MYTNVYCSTVYNSKDLESTQMSNNDRLDKENAVHIHHEILFSHKTQDHVPHRNMDGAGGHFTILLNKLTHEKKT